MSEVSRIEQAREQLPEMIGAAARIVADNPKEFGVVIAGSVVLARVMVNLVRPRNLFQAVCTMAICDLIAVAAVGEAAKRGYLRFQVRDADGALIPWKPAVPGDEFVD